MGKILVYRTEYAHCSWLEVNSPKHCITESAWCDETLGHLLNSAIIVSISRSFIGLLYFNFIAIFNRAVSRLGVRVFAYLLHKN